MRKLARTEYMFALGSASTFTFTFNSLLEDAESIAHGPETEVATCASAAKTTAKAKANASAASSKLAEPSPEHTAR